jgi:hypothetical protein
MTATKTSKRAAMKNLRREIAELGEISASMDAAKDRGDYTAFSGDCAAFIAKHERIMALWATV